MRMNSPEPAAGESISKSMKLRKADRPTFESFRIAGLWSLLGDFRIE
jgi:hypothetical protein